MGVASLVKGLNCISRMYLKNESMEWTDFCVLVQIQES